MENQIKDKRIKRRKECEEYKVSKYVFAIPIKLLLFVVLLVLLMHTAVSFAHPDVVDVAKQILFLLLLLVLLLLLLLQLVLSLLSLWLWLWL